MSPAVAATGWDEGRVASTMQGRLFPAALGAGKTGACAVCCWGAIAAATRPIAKSTAAQMASCLAMPPSSVAVRARKKVSKGAGATQVSGLRGR